MTTAKFKVGDMVRVITNLHYNQHEYEKGEEYKISNMWSCTEPKHFCYSKSKCACGLFENDLELAKIINWKQRIGGSNGI